MYGVPEYVCVVFVIPVLRSVSLSRCLTCVLIFPLVISSLSDLICAPRWIVCALMWSLVLILFLIGFLVVFDFSCVSCLLGCGVCQH